MPSTLSSITVSGDYKTDYVEGQSFSTQGMIVTAHYSDGSSKVVTDYVVDPTGALGISDDEVIITYTDGGITRELSLDITVSPDTPVGLFVEANGFYEAGQVLDADTLDVSVIYEHSASRPSVDISDCMLESDKDDSSDGRITLVEGQQTITVSATIDGASVEGAVIIVANPQGSSGGFDVLVTEHNGSTVDSVNFHGYALGNNIIQPGDSEVLKLRITPRMEPATIVLDVSTISGHEPLAGHIKVEAIVDGVSKTKMLSEFTDGHLVIHESLTEVLEITLKLSFEHRADNNEVMGKTMSFTMSVAAYGGSS